MIRGLILIVGGAIALIGFLTLIGYIVERIRDRLDPSRTQPVVFDRYKTRMFDQDSDCE